MQAYFRVRWMWPKFYSILHKCNILVSMCSFVLVYLYCKFTSRFECWRFDFFYDPNAKSLYHHMLPIRLWVSPCCRDPMHRYAYEMQTMECKQDRCLLRPMDDLSAISESAQARHLCLFSLLSLSVNKTENHGCLDHNRYQTQFTNSALLIVWVALSLLELIS